MYVFPLNPSPSESPSTDALSFENCSTNEAYSSKYCIPPLTHSREIKELILILSRIRTASPSPLFHSTILHREQSRLWPSCADTLCSVYQEHHKDIESVNYLCFHHTKKRNNLLPASILHKSTAGRIYLYILTIMSNGDYTYYYYDENYY